MIANLAYSVLSTIYQICNIFCLTELQPFFAIQGGLNSDGLQFRNRHYYSEENKTFFHGALER